MRLTRMLLLPFACLGLMAALTAFPPRSVDYGVTYLERIHDAIDHARLDIFIEPVAVVDEAAAVDVPADAHRVAYTIANQPGAAWRLAADAYRHIDPGRLLV